MFRNFSSRIELAYNLKKRENFKKVFDDFDYKKIALYNEDKIQSLLNDKGIIRNELKIRAIVNNALVFMKIQEDLGSFSNYIWNFVDGQPLVGKWNTEKEVPSKTELSDKISEDLKKEDLNLLEAQLSIRIYKQQEL